MLDDDYVVRLSCDRLRARVWLNGCSVLEVWDDRARLAEHSLRPWIVDGANRLDVFLGPATTEAEEAEEPTFSLAVFKPLRGLPPLDTHELLRYVWTDNESSLDPDGLRRVFSHTAHLEGAGEPWAWREAAPFRPEDRPAIEEQVTALHRAIGARDLPLVLRLFERKLSEVARGVGTPEEGLREELREQLSAWFGAPDFVLEERSPDLLTLETAASGRLVHVRGPEGSPPLRGKAGGRPFALGVTMSQVEGRWVVIR
jgi:hypothetical protein